jgi:hypothetical protein
MAGNPPAGSTQTAAKADCQLAAKAIAAERGQSGVELRLRVRHLRRWSAKCLTVTDEFTKEGLAIDVVGSIRLARVIEVLSRCQ